MVEAIQISKLLDIGYERTPSKRAKENGLRAI